ncbi:hypothetical protein FKW77_009174 [Venturia effusa]|uniref:Uncharacterized protein n=1 Tax=Venturia effusa TaxID=50376 RepID=A0A517L1Y3_9PEZI|nr:hypothetical protein FKW77_009174 [Venturia effusa]
MSDAAQTRAAGISHETACHEYAGIHGRNDSVKPGNGRDDDKMSASSFSGSEAVSSIQHRSNIKMAPSSCSSRNSGEHDNVSSRPGSRDPTYGIKKGAQPTNFDTPRALPNGSPIVSGTVTGDPAAMDKSRRLDDIVSRIGLFIESQDEVTGSRIASQQKHRAIKQAREEVSTSDKAFVDAVRKARVDLPSDLLVLLDSLEEARNRLGPLEHEMDRLEFKQVSKEHELKQEGERIRQRFYHVVRGIPAELDEEDEEDDSASYASSEEADPFVGDKIAGTALTTPNASFERLNMANDGIRRPDTGTIQLSTRTLAGQVSMLGNMYASETRRGIGNVETNLDWFAPDLSRPWTIQNTDPYVHHSNNGRTETDVLGEGDFHLQICEIRAFGGWYSEIIALSLQETSLETAASKIHEEQCTFLSEQHGLFSYSALILAGGIGGLVNGWLRSVLQVSRFETMLLSHFVAGRDKRLEQGWSQSAKQLWDDDDTVNVPSAPRTTSPSAPEVREYSNNGSGVVSWYSRMLTPVPEPEQHKRTTWSGKHEIYARSSHTNAPLILELRTASNGHVRSVP